MNLILSQDKFNLKYIKLMASKIDYLFKFENNNKLFNTNLIARF